MSSSMGRPPSKHHVTLVDQYNIDHCISNEIVGKSYRVIDHRSNGKSTRVVVGR